MLSLRLVFSALLLLFTLELAYGDPVYEDIADKGESGRAHATTLLRASLTGYTLTALQAQADLIVRGHVVTAVARWADETRTIVTDVEIAPLYTLRGQAPDVIRVTVEGGELADEDLAMVSSSGITFAPGEHVLLFLHIVEAGEHTAFAVVGHAAGKYTVAHAKIAGGLLETALELGEFYTRLHEAAPHDALALPAEWQAMEAAAAPTLPVRASDYVYNNVHWPGEYPSIDFYVNLNTRQAGTSDGSPDDFLAAIVDAATVWNSVESAAFVFHHAGDTSDMEVGYNGSNSILFDPSLGDNVLGVTRYWYNSRTHAILEVDVAFNDSVDFDATGAPASHEIDLASVALHEFGHWLSLGHDSEQEAVMYAALSAGTRQLDLAQSDIDGISAIYPCPETPCLLGATTESSVIVLPEIQPDDTDPPAGAVVLPVDEAVTVAFGADPDATIELALEAASVEPATQLAHSAAVHAPQVDNHTFTGQSFQIHAFVDAVHDPELALQRPATLTFQWNDASLASTTNHNLALFRFDEAAGVWVDAACGTGDEGSASPNFIVCVLGEFALFQRDAADAPQTAAEVFLPLVARP